MSVLIIVRHGQSVWNLENRFTGEVDVDLTPQGEEEAKRAGQLLKSFNLDVAFTSVLRRAIRTLEIILTQTGDKNIPIIRDSSLNERNYGALQGLNKTETEKQYGPDQVLKWRRSFDVAPPQGESLKNTCDRVIPYYQKEIEPLLRAGKNTLIVAHGNSLRALMMHLEDISEKDIVNVNLATGAPRLYEFDNSMRLQTYSYIQ